MAIEGGGEMGGLASDRPDLLAGRYLLGDVIGRGGMGVVQRAWDIHLDRYVAVKLLRELAMDPINRARFSAEGKILAALNHPGLITLFDAATLGHEPYLVMELVEGPSLKDRCNGVGMSVGEVAAIGVPLAEALAYVHRQHIVHRDLKPSNVLFAADGRVKLADFGIARLVDGVTRHTASGIAVGTAAYLSPEQVRDEPVTAASDIYSLGLVLMEALAGAPVFIGPPSVIVQARLTTAPAVDQRLPAVLRDLLGAMTAIRPQERPTADEVAAELTGLLPTSGALRTTSGSVPLRLVASGAPTTTLPRDPQRTLPIPVPAPGPEPADEPACEPGYEPSSYEPRYEPSYEPLTSRARARRPVGLVWVGVVAVAVVIGALMFGPLKDRSGNPGAGQGGTVHSGTSLPAGPAIPDPAKAVDKAKEEGKQALTKAGENLKHAAQDKIKQAADAAKKAAEKVARKAVKEAEQKAADAVTSALNALKGVVSPGGKSGSG